MTGECVDDILLVFGLGWVARAARRRCRFRLQERRIVDGAVWTFSSALSRSLENVASVSRRAAAMVYKV